MHFVPNEYYHVYNRGNNKQLIFFTETNYLFFLKKVRAQLLPCSDIVAYCLMPNHFHFLLRANENGLKERESFGGKPMQELAYRIGILLSSYSQAINKQNNTIGSLFQQKTKAKFLSEENNGSRISYFEKCFHYIHRNPLSINKVTRLEDWPYSSYLDYAELRNGVLCNKEIFFSLTGMTVKDIIERTNMEIEEKIIEQLF